MSFCFIAQSQEVHNNKKINIGFETGVQFTGVTDPYMQISKSGIGYNGGVFIEYPLSELIKVKLAMHYDNRAFGLESTGRIIDDSLYHAQSSYLFVKEDYKVNYLTIPVSIMYVKGSDKFKFFIQGSLYYSLLLNSKQSGQSELYISEQDAPYLYFKDHPEFSTPGYHSIPQRINTLNTSDMGINLFFGGIYYIKPELGISLSPGFTYAFTNVWEDPLRTATWSRLYKLTAGIVYSIK